MKSNTAVDQLLQSLSFEVEAVPQDNVVNFKNSHHLTPLNVRVRVRKKAGGNAVVHKGMISVPNLENPNAPPEIVRLVNSDQTVMSFNMLMEAEFERKQKKHKRNIFGLCLGVQGDDDDKYFPSTSQKHKDIDSRSDSVMEKISRSTPKHLPVTTSHTSYRTKDKFFGKCKPGGCLDPAYDEDNYAYEPRHAAHETPVPKLIDYEGTEKDKNKKTDFLDASVSKSKKQEGPDDDNVLSLYKHEAEPDDDADSIITYPPAMSSNELVVDDEKNKKSGKKISKETRDSFNEFNNPYYSPPREQRRSSQIYDENNKTKVLLPPSSGKHKDEVRISDDSDSGDEKDQKDSGLQTAAIAGAAVAGGFVTGAGIIAATEASHKKSKPTEEPISLDKNTLPTTDAAPVIAAHAATADSIGDKDKTMSLKSQRKSNDRLGLEDIELIGTKRRSFEDQITQPSSERLALDREKQEDAGIKTPKDISTRASQKSTPRTKSPDLATENVYLDKEKEKGYPYNKVSSRASKESMSDQTSGKRKFDGVDVLAAGAAITAASAVTAVSLGDKHKTESPKPPSKSDDRLGLKDRELTGTEKESFKDQTTQQGVRKEEMKTPKDVKTADVSTKASQKSTPRTKSQDRTSEDVYVNDEKERQYPSSRVSQKATPKSTSKELISGQQHFDGVDALTAGAAISTAAAVTAARIDDKHKTGSPKSQRKSSDRLGLADSELISRDQITQQDIRTKEFKTPKEVKAADISTEASQKSTPKTKSQDRASDIVYLDKEKAKGYPSTKVSPKISKESRSKDQISEKQTSDVVDALAAGAAITAATAAILGDKHKIESPKSQRKSGDRLDLKGRELIDTANKNYENQMIQPGIGVEETKTPQEVKIPDVSTKASQKSTPRTKSQDRASENVYLEKQKGFEDQITQPSSERLALDRKKHEDAGIKTPKDVSTKASQKSTPRTKSQDRSSENVYLDKQKGFEDQITQPCSERLALDREKQEDAGIKTPKDVSTKASQKSTPRTKSQDRSSENVYLDKQKGFEDQLTQPNSERLALDRERQEDVGIKTPKDISTRASQKSTPKTKSPDLATENLYLDKEKGYPSSEVTPKTSKESMSTYRISGKQQFNGVDALAAGAAITAASAATAASLGDKHKTESPKSQRKSGDRLGLKGRELIDTETESFKDQTRQQGIEAEEIKTPKDVKKADVSTRASQKSTPRTKSQDRNSEDLCLSDEKERQYPSSRVSQKATRQSISKDQISGQQRFGKIPSTTNKRQSFEDTITPQSDKRTSKDSSTRASLKSTPRTKSFDKTSEKEKQYPSSKVSQKTTPGSISKDRISGKQYFDGIDAIATNATITADYAGDKDKSASPKSQITSDEHLGSQYRGIIDTERQTFEDIMTQQGIGIEGIKRPRDVSTKPSQKTTPRSTSKDRISVKNNLDGIAAATAAAFTVTADYTAAAVDNIVSLKSHRSSSDRLSPDRETITHQGIVIKEVESPEDFTVNISQKPYSRSWSHDRTSDIGKKDPSRKSSHKSSPRSKSKDEVSRELSLEEQKSKYEHSTKSSQHTTRSSKDVDIYQDPILREKASDRQSKEFSENKFTDDVPAIDMYEYTEIDSTDSKIRAEHGKREADINFENEQSNFGTAGIANVTTSHKDKRDAEDAYSDFSTDRKAYADERSRREISDILGPHSIEDTRDHKHDLVKESHKDTDSQEHMDSRTDKHDSLSSHSDKDLSVDTKGPTDQLFEDKSSIKTSTQVSGLPTSERDASLQTTEDYDYFDNDVEKISSRSSGKTYDSANIKKSQISDMGESSYLMDVDDFGETGKRSKSLSMDLQEVVEGDQIVRAGISPYSIPKKDSQKSKSVPIIEDKRDVKETRAKVDQNQIRQITDGRVTKPKTEDSIFLNLAFQTYLEDNQTVIRTLDSNKDNDIENVVFVKSLIKSPEMNAITVPIDADRIMKIQIRANNVPSPSQSDKKSKFVRSSISKVDKGRTASTLSLGRKLSITLSTVFNQELVPLQKIINGLKQDIDELAIKQLKLKDRIGQGPGKPKRLPVKCGCLKNYY